MSATNDPRERTSPYEHEQTIEPRCEVIGAHCAEAAGSELPVPPYRWVPIEDVLAVIRHPRWMWPRNWKCKYIGLRLDTRTGHCLIYDGEDGHEITLRELSRQGDKYLLPQNTDITHAPPSA